MQNEETYQDLTLLFEAQDEAFADDAFTEQVMVPIRKQSRWRSPLLFGAGGLGIGAAISQIGELRSLVSGWAPEVSVPVATTPSLSSGIEAMNPLWIAAAGIMTVCCLAIIVSERV